MASKNTSDSIEAYIKSLLAQAGIAELMSVTTTDDVLGSEAHRLRANILRKIIQQVDRKGM